MKIEENKSCKGFFITFEGPDGSGKTTIVNKVYNYLSKKIPHCVVKTREPGGTNNFIAEDIRKIILNKLNYKITPITEALLFAASRAQHVHDFIMPNLQKGKIILCDRFVHSSYIYQGIARGVGLDKVKKINDFSLNGLWPNLIFVLMLKPIDCLKRISNKKKNREFNRIDAESLRFHKKVYLGYKELIRKYPKNIIMIDANKELEFVFKKIINIIDKKLVNYGK